MFIVNDSEIHNSLHIEIFFHYYRTLATINFKTNLGCCYNNAVNSIR